MVQYFTKLENNATETNTLYFHSLHVLQRALYPHFPIHADYCRRGQTPSRTAVLQQGLLLVNVSRAGAANLDVIQEQKYVKFEAKVVYLLECLQKTAMPVASIHSGKD